MNKYERALELISKEINNDHLDNEFQVLDELIDKATPMNVHNSSVMANGTACWLCPKCKEFVYYTDKYCSSCGQRIEWK